METFHPQSTVVWATDNPLSSLLCVACGGSFDAPIWQPRMRCPHCETLGYPDRSGRNLLPLDWECPTCGEINDGRVNFCLSCGAGLTSRCLRCEHPVYGSVCDACGAPQSRLVHLKNVEAHRETWVPVLRERIQQQRLQEEIDATRNHNPDYGVVEWQAIDQQWRDAAQQRRQRVSAKRQSRRGRGRSRGSFMGWLWLIVGVMLLVGTNWETLRGEFEETGVTEALAQMVSQIEGLLNVNLPQTGIFGENVSTWWNILLSSFGQPIDPASDSYAYLFATAVFGLALLPALFYLLSRLVRRLFPD